MRLDPAPADVLEAAGEREVQHGASGRPTSRTQLWKPGGQEREEPVGRAGEVSDSFFSLFWLPPAAGPCL